MRLALFIITIILMSKSGLFAQETIIKHNLFNDSFIKSLNNDYSVSLSPNPFNEYTSFSQQLNLNEGDLSIHSVNITNEVKFLFWVDLFKPVINISIECENPVDISANYETWRIADKPLYYNSSTGVDEGYACFSYRQTDLKINRM